MGAAGAAGATGEITRSEILRAARARYLRGERIDLVALAGDLGIARATLYRWFGGRNELEGEMFWEMGSRVFDRAVALRRPSGADGVAAVLTEFLTQMTTFGPFQIYLARDPARAMDVLTTFDGVVASGFRARVEALVLEECPEAVGPDLSAGELAYALRRVFEAYCYADILADRPIDAQRARPVFRRLLQGERA